LIESRLFSRDRDFPVFQQLNSFGGKIKNPPLRIGGIIITFKLFLIIGE
jgi:hypothetical protein